MALRDIRVEETVVLGRLATLSSSHCGVLLRAVLGRPLFERLIADTQELQEEAFRLRYQVYCIENPYEDATRYPEGLEYDQYDQHSLHGVLRHRRSGATIGSVRWVLHKKKAGAASFPLFHVCRDLLPLVSKTLPVERTAELSRFALSKHLRQQHCTSHGQRADELSQKGHSSAHTALGLVTLALQIAFVHDIDYMVAAMEPTLIRLLSRFGLKFELMGPLINYHGLRQPCFAHLSTLIARVENEQPEVWRLMTDGGRAWPSASAFEDREFGYARGYKDTALAVFA